MLFTSRLNAPSDFKMFHCVVYWSYKSLVIAALFLAAGESLLTPFYEHQQPVRLYMENNIEGNLFCGVSFKSVWC